MDPETDKKRGKTETDNVSEDAEGVDSTDMNKVKNIDNKNIR